MRDAELRGERPTEAFTTIHSNIKTITREIKSKVWGPVDFRAYCPTKRQNSVRLWGT